MNVIEFDTNLPLVMQDSKTISGLALDIIRLGQSSVLVSLRFLDAAYFRLVLAESTDESLSTDGVLLSYDPNYILTLFMQERNRVARDILHTVLHCIFHHLFIGRPVRPLYWDLACDIAVEAQIEELELPAIESVRSFEQQIILDSLRDELSFLSAEKLYRHFLNSDMTEQELKNMRSTFAADDHRGWYQGEGSADQNDASTDEQDDEKQDKATSQVETDAAQDDEDDTSLQTESEGRQDNNEEDQQQNPNKATPDLHNEKDCQNKDGADSDADNSSAVDSDAEDKAMKTSQDVAHLEPDTHSGSYGNDDSEKRVWSEISERIEIDLEMFSSGQGDAPAGLLKDLKRLNREEYDYETFLRKFTVLGETLKVNDEEFDYIFYTYGLDLYENMPLIEPLEYQDSYRIRDFVIAIDTSGSTEGHLVESFINKTYNMLKQSENFFTRINIHIIQCDCAIKDVAKISNDVDFANYINDLQLHGMGGTDFRPVFAYVEDQLAQGEFINLGGLIYFTDGFGTYPEKDPLFKTAFVFIDNDNCEAKVPVWAMKLFLESEDL